MDRQLITKGALLALALAGAARAVRAQQVPDPNFVPHVSAPAFSGGGPLVLLDEAHHNFHTAAGRYAPFVRVLRADGFVVASNHAVIAPDVLRGARVLVIANALPDDGPWVLPTRPAFSAAEVKAIHDWVANGGSLLLIADHMPFPGAVAAIADAFGVTFHNGFALRTTTADPPMTFRRSDNSLGASALTEGRGRAERIDSVLTFTGQAFEARRAVVPVFTLDSSVTLYLPERAWEFTDRTRRTNAGGMLQGAILKEGAGRVALFGEAGLFSAQVQGPQHRPMGMNAPGAEQNQQFLLNVMHWLVGAIEP